MQKADCGLDLRRVTVIELLGSPPRETGRIKENLLTAEVVEGLRCVLRLSVVQRLCLLSAGWKKAFQGGMLLTQPSFGLELKPAHPPSPNKKEELC